MPYEQVIPPAFPKWEIDQTYPLTHYQRTATGTAAGAGISRSAANASNRASGFVIDVAGNSTLPNWAVHNGIPCMMWRPGVVVGRPSCYFYGNNVGIPGPLNNEGFNAAENFMCAQPVPSWKRVYIDEYLVAFSTAGIGALDIGTMIWSAVPDQSGNQANIYRNAGVHYGLRADGAGGVEFYSVIGAVLQEATAITWPTADYRDWVKVIVEHQMANIGGAAQLRIWLNDITNLQVNRNWGAGTTLPDMTDAGTGRTIRRYVGQGALQPTDTMFTTAFRCRAGRYTADGTELT